MDSNIFRRFLNGIISQVWINLLGIRNILVNTAKLLDIKTTTWADEQSALSARRKEQDGIGKIKIKND